MLHQLRFLCMERKQFKVRLRSIEANIWDDWGFSAYGLREQE